tara:strand:+ start:96 stop:548 length:453 start_codon:yes stop_codon:yes gene_type:complete
MHIYVYAAAVLFLCFFLRRGDQEEKGTICVLQGAAQGTCFLCSRLTRSLPPSSFSFLGFPQICCGVTKLFLSIFGIVTLGVWSFLDALLILKGAGEVLGLTGGVKAVVVNVIFLALGIWNTIDIIMVIGGHHKIGGTTTAAGEIPLFIDL